MGRVSCHQSMAFRIRSPAAVATARIFEHRIGDGERSAWKVLNRTPALSEKVFDYYPRPFETYRFPEYISPSLTTSYWRRMRRARKGKMSVKKGQGKRAKKAAGRKKHD